MSTGGSDTRTESDRRERRRHAMLDAARKLFVERGYDAVSLSEIVKLSGGSLATLYELFENKAGLLGAIVASQRFGTHEKIDAVIERDGAPAAMLKEIAGILIDGFSDPETLGLIRVVMGETLRDPAFAQSIFEAAHIPSVERLSALFADWHAAGRATIPDPMLAVHMFLGLVLHAPQTRALFGESCNPLMLPRDALLREATAMFVTRYGIDAA
ncbi:hypothetical protein ACFB49_41590 [Sphingomonas sp. DBB INV C78]